MRLSHITSHGFSLVSQFTSVCSGDSYRGLKRNGDRDTDKAQASHMLNHYLLTAALHHFEERPGQSSRGECWGRQKGPPCPLPRGGTAAGSGSPPAPPLPLITPASADTSPPPVTKAGQRAAASAQGTPCSHQHFPTPCQDEPPTFPPTDKAEPAPGQRGAGLRQDRAPRRSRRVHALVMWRLEEPALTREAFRDLKHVLKGSFIRTGAIF